MYRFEVCSNFKQLYRYNTIIIAVGYNGDGKELYTANAEMIYREEIDTNIAADPAPPADFKVGKALVLECDDAHSIHATIYVITNTLPKDRVVKNSPPFPLEVRVSHDDEVISETTYEVNQWGGDTINIKL